MSDNSKKRKIEEVVKVTPFSPARLEKINAAYLSPKNNSQIKNIILQPSPQTRESAISFRNQCKFTQLMIEKSTENDIQVKACLETARNCLIAEGVLPINTKDPTDALTVNTLFTRLETYPIVFSKSMILQILLICPTFCQYMIKEFNVDPYKMDSFVNQVDSNCTMYYAQYIHGIVLKSPMFLALSMCQWLEYMPKKIKN